MWLGNVSRQNTELVIGLFFFFILFYFFYPNFLITFVYAVSLGLF
jgi:hypothetical protein